MPIWNYYQAYTNDVELTSKMKLNGNKKKAHVMSTNKGKVIYR